MTDYSGIFLRDALGDGNALPRAGDSDTSSPDIINSGTTPSSNPQTDYGDSYDQDVGAPLAYGARNNIYVRGKNDASGNAVGSAALYWCYATQLDTPSSWQQLSTAAGANASALGADAAGVAVTAAPFVWTPEKPSGNPYVLIAAVSDAVNANPVLAYQKAHHPSSFAVWQADQGGVAALQFAPPPPPTVKPTYTFGGVMTLHNTAQQQLSFTLEIEGGVIGDHVSCSFDATDVNGQPMGVGSTQITQANMNVGFQATVGAGFNTRFSFEYATQNINNPPNPTLTLLAAGIAAGGGGGNDPFGPNSGNSQGVPVAQFVMTTSLPG